MTETLLTAKDVAKYFSVSQESVRRWERDGLLRSVRIVGSVRFSEEAIREFIAKNERERETA